MTVEIDRRFDRRCERRFIVSHRFIVTHPDVGEIECNTRDVSLSGAFVEGDFSAIAVGSTVTIIFERTSTRINSPGKVTQHTFDAVLVRKTEEGAGLRFTHQDPKIDAAILYLIYDIWSDV